MNTSPDPKNLDRVSGRRPRQSRGRSVRRFAGVALTALSLGLGFAGATGALDLGVAGTGRGGLQHGEAHLYFPPWISEPEAVFRIHRAGGVPIANPGEETTRSGMFRVITASEDFAARIRAEGALFVLF